MPDIAMPDNDATTMLHGSCHCGQLQVEFSSPRHAADIAPRACDCSFCRKHGAAYVSDPRARLSILETTAGALREYRQGSGTARFLLCARCGVLVGVVFAHGSRLYGAANAGCLDDATGLAEATTISPSKLDAEDKASRWVQLWVPDVVVVEAVG